MMVPGLHRSAVAALLLGAAIVACRSLSTTGDQANLLRTIERERLRTLVDADVETAARLHADDFQLINPLGGSFSKEQYLGAIESGQVDYIVWEPESSIEVRAIGDAAVLRYRSRLEVEVAGQRVPLQRYWHTDTYEKRDGRWQVVWSHATQIQ